MAGKRGQGWSFDLMIASSIAMIAIVTFYFFTLNYEAPDSGVFEEMKQKASEISSDLLSEGRPTNWSETNVALIGLTSDNKINESKLGVFQNLTINNYDMAKRLFGSRYNYFVSFSEPIATSPYIEGIGSPPAANALNVYKTTRFTIYKNKSATMYVTIWE